MRVSVVLCTYSPSMYDEFVEAAESLFDQTHPDVEVVIVVDGTPEVFERAAEDFGERDDVILHLNDQNRGLLESRNRGAELATGDVVAFIDDDAIAAPDWIEALVSVYESREVVAVGGKMVPKWVAGRPAFLPSEFYWLVGVTHEGFADAPGEVRNTFGSNISFRRDVFRDLGGFDTDIGGRQGTKNLQGGETELCARMAVEYGSGVWYTPEAEVAHKVFEYRTSPRWLLDRAFWQGYSKRVMEGMLPGESDDGVEAGFLGYLLWRAVPTRLRGLVQTPSTSAVLQLAMIGVFTAAVGSGYLYAVLRSSITSKPVDPRST